MKYMYVEVENTQNEMFYSQTFLYSLLDFKKDMNDKDYRHLRIQIIKQNFVGNITICEH